jgi:flagellar hook capping protein FlgD/beta-propeller uncharacterized protein DUF5122
MTETGLFRGSSFLRSRLFSRRPIQTLWVNCMLLASVAMVAAAQAQSIREDFYVTNDGVSAVAVSGSTLYIAGYFTQVGPATGSGVPIVIATGVPVDGFPKVVGSVDAVLPDGAGGWYIGGAFTRVGGVPRSNLAHILADQMVSDWNPDANGLVRALLLSGGIVYVGGDFTNIGGKTRNYIAALDASSGTVTPWNPNANLVASGYSQSVAALAVSGSTVYAGGSFSSIGGEPRNCIAALDVTTGAATSWNPTAYGAVYALAVSGGTVYAGGEFTSIGGQSRNCIAALDTTTGAATAWNPNAEGRDSEHYGYVYALAVSGGTVYAGGEFSSIGGQGRNCIAALDTTTGAATPWNPAANMGIVYALAVSGGTVYAGGEFTSIGGQSRNYIAALDTTTTGAATSWNPNANREVLALAVSGATVYAGGDFTSIGGKTRNHIAALDVATGAVTPWDPNANNYVFALALSGGTVYAGGYFSTIGGQTRNGIAALDGATGAATPWNPNVTGSAWDLAVSGGTVYASGYGYFNGIGGQTRHYIAALDATTGEVTPWNPNPDYPVHALAVSGSTVYAGGAFTNIGGQARYHIAALDATTGAATSWNPDPRDAEPGHVGCCTVGALTVSEGTVYVGGNFFQIGGQSRNNIAALDTTTGAATPWNPNPNHGVSALAVRGGTVYASGDFTSIGGQMRNYIAALDATTGEATPWNLDATTDTPWNRVSTLVVSAGTVYAAGGFRSIGGLPQSYIAAIESAVVAVQVENLSALQSESGVLLTWRLSAVAVGELLGVFVQRADSPEGPFASRVSSALEPDLSMTFTDDAALPGRTYWYRLALLGREGVSTFSPAVKIATGPGSRLKTDLSLESVQAHRDRVEIRFVVGLPKVPMHLDIYDVTGKKVWSLAETASGPGEHVVVWDGRNAAGIRVPRGVYLVRFQAERVSTAKKLVLLGR